jgi:hypothetical protein
MIIFTQKGNNENLQTKNIQNSTNSIPKGLKGNRP